MKKLSPLVITLLLGATLNIGTITAACPTSHFVTLTAKHNVNEICFGTSTVLTASGADSYYWLHNEEYGAAKIVFPVGSRTYTVVGTNAEGCNDTVSIFITVYPLPDITVFPKRICIGETTVLTAYGGIAYAWISPEEFLDKTTQSITVSTTETTTYSVSGIDMNGCVNIGGAKVTVMPYPTLPAIPPQIMCAEAETNEVILHGSPQPKPDEDWVVDYFWNVKSNDGVTGAMGGANDTIYPHTLALTTGRTTAGTLIYNVTPHVEHCIGDAVPFEITVKPLPTVDFIPPVEICSETSTAETALSSTPVGANFEWTVVQDGVSGATDGYGTSIPATELILDEERTTAGTATYDIVAKLNGCEGKTHGSFEVTVHPTPTVSEISPQDLCSGSSTSAVALTSTPAGANFSWIALSNHTAGATNGNGNTIPSAQLDLNSGYALSDTVFYIITPTLGICTGKTDTLEVRVNPKPEMPAITNQTVCSGDAFNEITLSSTLTNTDFNWTVVQDGVSGAVFGAGDKIPSALLHLVSGRTTAGKGTYTVTPSIGACNGSSQNFDIIVNPLPTAFISYTFNTNTATVNQTGQAGGTYSTVPSSGLDINPSTGEININTSVTGTYTVTYLFSNGTCNNTTSTTLVINNPALPGVTISYHSGITENGIAAFCARGSASVTRTGGTAGDGGVYGATPLGLTIDPASGEINLENSATGTYKVTYQYSTNSIYTNITILALPTANIAPQTQKICDSEKGQATITVGSGTSPYRYIWTRNSGAFIDENSNSSTQNIDSLTVGEYQIRIIDNKGCEMRLPLSISVENKPTVKLATENIGEICAESNFQLHVLNNAPLENHLWEYSDDNLTWNTLSNEETLKSTAIAGRRYRISASSTEACAEMSDAFSLNVLPKPNNDLTLTADRTNVEPGETVTFTLATANTEPLKWTENGKMRISNEKVFSERIFDNKSVQVSIDNGVCPEIFSEQINISAAYPTAITPYTLDGLNDDFLTKTNCRMIIFNRYGQKVYEGTDGWNGYYAGALADPGAYFYVLYLPDGAVKKGTIEVVRVK